MYRLRDEKHLRRLRLLPCIRCANDQGSDAAHLRFSCAAHQKVNPGVGRKPDDRDALPMCRRCHTLQHEIGEEAFWKGCDPIGWARQLYEASGDINAEMEIIRRALKETQNALQSEMGTTYKRAVS